jgi:phospholipid/cholesterol/gamma-HCH transport system substrate-binding protein
MSHDLPYRQRVLIGLITLILMAGVATIGLKFSTGAYSDVYTLHAIFGRTGHGLDNSSAVKIRGVNVGRVSTVKLLPDGRADVSLRMQHGVRVPDTTAASAEPLSVFGPLYIKLDPGAHESRGPFLAAGAHITDTTPPTEITDLLNQVYPILSAVDPQDLVTVFHTIAQGVDGLGPALGRTIDNGSKLVGLIDRQSANARQFFVDLARLSNALGDKGAQLIAGAQDLNAVLPILSSRPDQIGQILDAASRLSGDLADLINGHYPALDQTIAGSITIIQPIYQQLALFPSFLRALNGFFAQLGSGLLRLPYQGHVIGVLEGQEPADICLLLLGVGTCKAP